MSINHSVSVVIPVYNGERLIRRSLRPFMAVKNPLIEVIVVNDASTDKTAERINEIKEGCDWLRFVDLKANRGPLAARLAGLREATGEYIAFLDCGDTIKIEELLLLLQEAVSKRADIAVGGIDLVMRHLGSIRYSNPKSAYERIVKVESEEAQQRRLTVKAILDGALTASMCDKLFRRDWLLKYLPEEIDTKVGEDYYFTAMTVPFAEKIIFTDIPFYRWTYSGLATKYFLHKYAENSRTMEKVFQSLPDVTSKAGLSLDSTNEAVGQKFMYQIMLGVAEALRSRETRKDVDLWAAKMFDTNAMRLALSAIESFKGVRVTDLTPEKMIQLAREHIKRHRKYYIFTRVLSLIYRR